MNEFHMLHAGSFAPCQEVTIHTRLGPVQQCRVENSNQMACRVGKPLNWWWIVTNPLQIHGMEYLAIYFHHKFEANE